jgi:hypothetical protein
MLETANRNTLEELHNSLARCVGITAVDVVVQASPLSNGVCWNYWHSEAEGGSRLKRLSLAPWD